MSSARSAALVAVFLVGVTACFGGGPKPSFYTLSAASGAAAGAPVASKPTLGLAVGPIEFPRYLDRPEIVVRDGSYELIVMDAHRWGGTMRTDILRVVADDLGRLLGTPRVVVYPNDARFKADYRVLLDVLEFERVGSGNVVLRLRWTIASIADGSALAVEESRIEQPVASSSVADIVAAESTALGTVTRTIAERIASLPTK
jgi:uncharacterized lipoprotein YmbA